MSFISTVHELKSQLAEARQRGKKDGYFDLDRPVLLHAALGRSVVGLETRRDFAVPNLSGIDFSGFRITGDFRGANLTKANLDGSYWQKAQFETLYVNEHSPGQSHRDAAEMAGPFVPWAPPVPDDDEGNVERWEHFFGRENSFRTCFNQVSLNNVTFKDCRFGGVVADGCTGTSVTFESCDLNGCDLSAADLSNLHFEACDQVGLELNEGKLLPSDPPVTIPGAAEFLLNVVSVEAISAFTNLALQAQQVSKDIALWASLAVAVIYVVVSYLFSLRLPTVEKQFFRRLGTPVMCILAVEASLAFFQMVFDPNLTMAPGYYVITVAVIAVLSLVFIRYAVHATWKPRFYLTLREDMAALFLIAGSYAALYLYLHRAEETGWLATLLISLTGVFIYSVYSSTEGRHV